MAAAGRSFLGPLPEGIMELEFRGIYGDVDSEAYALVEVEIERRLKACRLYQ